MKWKTIPEASENKKNKKKASPCASRWSFVCPRLAQNINQDASESHFSPQQSARGDAPCCLAVSRRDRLNAGLLRNWNKLTRNNLFSGLLLLDGVELTRV